jgi:deazaflavin-dependent oxidoreductase (nitroreductase family)
LVMEWNNERLKRVAARRTVTLTHYGRKSGRPYNVTIWFVVDGAKVYIGTANVNRQWVRNVQKTPQIRLSIEREAFDGEARFLTDLADRDHAKALMRWKYWLFLPIFGLGTVLMGLGLMRDTTGFFEVTLAEA